MNLSDYIYADWPGVGVLRFWSLFAGVAGFDLGLEESGMECTLQVEKDKDCNRVLERHFRDVRRINDVALLRAMLEPKNAGRFSAEFVRPDLICGGFPCQDVSVAGKRAGLAGARSGLWFTFRRIIALVKPECVLIENVPGLLSSNGGRDMGTILGGLARIGYGVAYRILDAQYFGIPQRRRRVFIVGCLGDWKRAAQILFESYSLQGHSPPSREAREGVVAGLSAGSANGSGVNRPGRRREDDVNLVSMPLKGGGNLRHDESHDTYVPATKWWDGSDIAPCLDSSMIGKRQMMPEKGRLAAVVTHALTGEGHDASEDGTGRGTPLVAFTLHGSDDCRRTGSEADLAQSLRSRAPGTIENSSTTVAMSPVAFQTRIARNGRGQPKEITDALTSCEGGTHADSKPHVATRMGIRRLTPRECERLQGFPDDWTRYDAAGNELSDSARYRMCGNAVNVAVSRWLGKQLAQPRLPFPEPVKEMTQNKLFDETKSTT